MSSSPSLAVPSLLPPPPRGPRCVVIYSSHVALSLRARDWTADDVDVPVKGHLGAQLTSRWKGGRDGVHFRPSCEKKSVRNGVVVDVLAAGRVCAPRLVRSLSSFSLSLSLFSGCSAVHSPLHFSGLFDFRRSTSASAPQLLSFLRRIPEREKFRVPPRDERSPTGLGSVMTAQHVLFVTLCVCVPALPNILES